MVPAASSIIARIYKKFTCNSSGFIGSRGFLHLGRLHVEHFGDSSLHDKKVRVVDVKLDGSKEILHAVVLNVGSINQVFVLAADNHLTYIE